MSEMILCLTLPAFPFLIGLFLYIFHLKGHTVCIYILYIKVQYLLSFITSPQKNVKFSTRVGTIAHH